MIEKLVVIIIVSIVLVSTQSIQDILDNAQKGITKVVDTGFSFASAIAALLESFGIMPTFNQMFRESFLYPGYPINKLLYILEKNTLFDSFTICYAFINPTSNFLEIGFSAAIVTAAGSVTVPPSSADYSLDQESYYDALAANGGDYQQVTDNEVYAINGKIGILSELIGWNAVVCAPNSYCDGTITVIGMF